MTDVDDLDLTILSYLHNVTLTLLCELIHTQITRIKSIPIDNMQIHAASFDNKVTKKFKELFENGDLCDVTIVVEDAEFHTHKIVLAANSPVFDAMFTAGMKEQIENTVMITDTDTATFEAFLRYMYTGTVERNDGLVDDLLIIADKYDVVSLINLCKAYKANELNSRIRHYWRHCPNKKEITSMQVELNKFHQLKEFHLTSPAAQFVITNTNYECELKIEFSIDGSMSVQVRFPEDCKMILKVIVSYIDGSGKKLICRCSMKPEQTNSLHFSFGNYEDAIHSDRGNLTILCHLIYVDLTPIKSTVTEGELQYKNWSNCIEKKIELFFNDKCFCDVTVVVEDAEIYVHKAVLGTISLVFKHMFSENAVEPIGNTVTLDDVNATTVKALITFMYTGSVEKTEQLVRDLLILAKKYQVLDLVTLCENYEQRYLNPDKVNELIASHLGL